MNVDPDTTLAGQINKNSINCPEKVMKISHLKQTNQRLLSTGSFRKNGKSKTVFMSTKFHEKLIFSAFFSRELATNLRS